MPEFPHELIRQLQICSRAAAGLPDYNPDDPTLPALPSLAATIATLEPSPPHLRCDNCKGKLLRGNESNICIYCGCPHRTDVVPEPISFTSTTAYQGLLRSLHLDGSEIVKPVTYKNEQEQGQGSLKAEMPLSDFLNFRIAWPAETEKEEASVSDQHSKDSRRFLSFTGVAPDNFFFKSKRDTSDTSSEQPKMLNTTGTKEVAARDSPTLFQNVQSSDPAGISLKDRSSEVPFEWEANFQAAGSENQHSVSKSPDHFIGSSADSSNKEEEPESFGNFTGSEVDLGAHMDSMFGPGKDVNDGLPKDNPATSTGLSDWNSDELWNNVSSNESQLVGGFDDFATANDDHTLENPNDLSKNVDLFDDFQWQTNDTHVTENTSIVEEHKKINEDSFDEWNDFTGSSSLQDPFANVLIQSNDLLSTSDNRMSSEIDLFGTNSKFEGGDFGSFSEPNLSPSTSNSYFPAEVNATMSEESASKSEDVFNESTKTKDEVKFLVSQMHDLSFMLESDLSIPSSSDARNSSTRD